MAITNTSRALSKITAPLLNVARPLCDASVLKRTALHDFHVEHGGRMVGYAGWSMPVQYSDLTIANSCLHTRSKASIFDVSHMLQSTVTGPDAEAYLERVLVADLKNLPLGKGTLSVITNSSGGIIDDCIVTRTGPDSFYLVSNAGREDADMTHMMTQKSQFKNGAGQFELSPLQDRSLLALQGPSAASVLQAGVRGVLSEIKFMTSAVMEVYSIPDCRVSRCGYTGEDGFEISVPTERVVELADRFLSAEGGATTKLAGLGARDVLRLEAGLCLYGNDLSEETTPIEAGLAWCISKRRRAEGGFIGADTILNQLKNKPAMRRVGIQSLSGPPARNGATISLSSGGPSIGVVSSGSVSPSLKHNIAMAYLPREHTKIGTELQLHVRRHTLTGTLVKMPFVPNRYYN